jgi:hypothetical protein
VRVGALLLSPAGSSGCGGSTHSAWRPGSDVVVGIVLVTDWHGIRRRLAARQRARPLKIVAGLALFVGGGAIVTGIARLLGA